MYGGILFFGLVLWAGLTVILLYFIWLEFRWHNHREEMKASLKRGVNFYLNPPLPPRK